VCSCLQGDLPPPFCANACKARGCGDSPRMRAKWWSLASETMRASTLAERVANIDPDPRPRPASAPDRRGSSRRSPGLAADPIAVWAMGQDRLVTDRVEALVDRFVPRRRNQPPGSPGGNCTIQRGPGRARLRNDRLRALVSRPTSSRRPHPRATSIHRPESCCGTAAYRPGRLGDRDCETPFVNHQRLSGTIDVTVIRADFPSGTAGHRTRLHRLLSPSSLIQAVARSARGCGGESRHDALTDIDAGRCAGARPAAGRRTSAK